MAAVHLGAAPDTVYLRLPVRVAVTAARAILRGPDAPGRKYRPGNPRAPPLTV